MKNQDQINRLLRAFESRYGLEVVGAEQGSETWHTLKLGVISASNASKVVAKRDSETRATYMAELVAQVATGLHEEFLSNKYVEWGKQNEDGARAYYEFETGQTVKPVSFVFKDEAFREGCSPDGIVDDRKGCEIKCPFNSAHYVKFLADDKIKPEYQWQYQYTLRVMEAEEWDFVQYDPRMIVTPLKRLVVVRDAEKQKLLDDAVPQFIADMDAMLKRIGVEFGAHWKRKAVPQAQRVAV